MATSVWGRIKQAYQDSFRVTGVATGYYVARATLGNSRMKTLRATPYTIVEGIKGKILYPVSVMASAPEVATARSGSYDTRLEWDTSGTKPSATGDLDRATMHGSVTQDKFATAPMAHGGNNQDFESITGTALILRNVDGGEYTLGSSDNEVTFVVAYTVIEGE